MDLVKRWRNGNLKYVLLGILVLVTAVGVIAVLVTIGNGQTLDVNL